MIRSGLVRATRKTTFPRGPQSESFVVSHLVFEHEDHVYRAIVRPIGDWRGVWHVSIDGEREYPVFPARASDDDTEHFRRQLVAAALLAREHNRRTGGDRRVMERRGGDRRKDTG